MKNSHPIEKQLIAPCGMNCAVCSRYLAYVNHLKRSQCAGCRPENKECTYLFKKCGIHHPSKSEAAFCFECSHYPCKQLKRADERYRKNYGMSWIDNLEFIRRAGIDQFAYAQYEKYRCPRCGGLISVHNRKCFKCEVITRLVEILS